MILDSAVAANDYPAPVIVTFYFACIVSVLHFLFYLNPLRLRHIYLHTYDMFEARGCIAICKCMDTLVVVIFPFSYLCYSFKKYFWEIK